MTLTFGARGIDHLAVATDLEWSYNHSDGADQRALAGVRKNSGESDSTPITIAYQDIVSILYPNATRTEHWLLYVQKQDRAADDLSESPVILRALATSNLPLALLEEFPDITPSFLQQSKDDQNASPVHVDFIISTGSGTGRAQAAWKSLVSPLLQSLGCVEGETYHLHLTESDSTINNMTRDIFLERANKGAKQTVVLLSGDGGILDVANTLLHAKHTATYKKPLVAILPLGTGNALSHSAGITSDNTLGTRALLRGSSKDISLFGARFSSGSRLLVNEGKEERELDVVDGSPTMYGAVVLSWAFHATLVADSDTAEYRKFGSQRFQMAAKEALFPADGSATHAYEGKVSVLRPLRPEWEPLARESHGYVLATFCKELEKGFTINPRARTLDRQLRLVHFGALGGQGAMEVMGQAFNGGKHVDDERVGYEDIDGLRIEMHEDDPRWRRVCVDGNIVRVEPGGWVEVRSGIQDVVDVLIR